MTAVVNYARQCVDVIPSIIKRASADSQQTVAIDIDVIQLCGRRIIDGEVSKINELDKLKEDLKQAIKDERYEDAAKIRDEIKKKEEK